MDLFEKLRALSSVEKVSNFYRDEEPEEGFTFVGFLCPHRTIPFQVKRTHRGKEGQIVDVRTKYSAGLSQGAISRIDRIYHFQKESENFIESSRIVLVWADSDSYVCFVIPFMKIPAPPKVEGFDIISNRNIWEREENLKEYWNICRKTEKFLSKVPTRFVEIERTILSQIFSSNVPESLKQAIANKILASYILDGILLEKGAYGPNPVILGVESASVAIIQNCTFSQNKRIPVIELKR